MYIIISYVDHILGDFDRKKRNVKNDTFLRASKANCCLANNIVL